MIGETTKVRTTTRKGATPKGRETHKGMNKNPHDEEAKRNTDKANNKRLKTKEGAKNHGLVQNKSVENHTKIGKQHNVRTTAREAVKN